MFVIWSKCKITLELVWHERKRKISFDSLTATGGWWLLMVLPGLERSLFTFSIQHERQTWKGYERQLVIKATNLTEKAARMSRVHTSSVISGLGNFFPPGWIPAESSELYAVGLLGWDQTVWLWPVDAVARDLFASKRTPFNGNLFQRWKLIEANIVAYHSCDGTESVKHSTDLIWFNDLVSQQCWSRERDLPCFAFRAVS